MFTSRHHIASLIGTSIFRLITRRPRHDDHVDVWQGRRVDVRLKHPDPYQLDGDVVDDCRAEPSR
jgi:hypothetical protein